MKAVRYVGKATALPGDYAERLTPESNCAVVDSLPGGANVTLRLTIDGKPLEVIHDPLTRDFLDLATLVYIVDEMEPRKNTRDYWTRQFDVFFPVKDPSLWAANNSGLAQMLRTLAGDDYNFSWCKRPRLPGFGAHRQFIPRRYDAVCLFSGGIDSFLGAHHLLTQGKKLLLCGHQADGTAASAQKALAEALGREFPGQFRLIQCRVARSVATTHRFTLPEKCEETHRPRSLLFLALAIALANATKLDTIYIPENGLIALNPPLGKSRLGTLSTRTAHPKYLTELADFLYATNIFSGNIKNPFLFDSKTDMLRGIDTKLRPSMLRSVSCARPSRYKHLNVRHCGYCVPCIYRRVAMAEAGLDSPSDYGFRLFENISSVELAKQIDFRALVSFARRVVTATSVERDIIVVSNGHFPLAAAERFGYGRAASFSIWGDMLLRWSTDFLQKLNAMASAQTKRELRIQ
jgi:7-cyano-7-deazaguanine synthase in queuosine biosynthesis